MASTDYGLDIYFWSIEITIPSTRISPLVIAILVDRTTIHWATQHAEVSLKLSYYKGGGSDSWRIGHIGRQKDEHIWASLGSCLIFLFPVSQRPHLIIWSSDSHPVEWRWEHIKLWPSLASQNKKVGVRAERAMTSLRKAAIEKKGRLGPS